jgi:hypothetical protein
MSENNHPPPDYPTWLQDVKARIQAARIVVARAANRELILLYWDLGRGIVEKQELIGWGKSVQETLSADLSEAYPGVKGFSANNLWLMRQFEASLSTCQLSAASLGLLLRSCIEIMTHRIFMPSMATMKSRSRLPMALSRASFQDELSLTSWSGTSSIAKS